MTHFNSYIRRRPPSSPDRRPTFYIPVPPATVDQLLKGGKPLKDRAVSVILED